MQYPAATDVEVKLAQVPHNLFVTGLFLFDLLIAPAVIALDIGMDALLILVTWLISLGARGASMEHIMWTALTRIALMPSLILVMVAAVLEASAGSLATKREVPEKLASNFPPPNSAN